MVHDCGECTTQCSFRRKLSSVGELAVGGGYTGNVALDTALQALNEGSKQLEVDMCVWKNWTITIAIAIAIAITIAIAKPIAITPSHQTAIATNPSPNPIDPLDSCSFAQASGQGKPYGYYGDPSTGCRGYYTCKQRGAWYNECPPDLLFNELQQFATSLKM
eukprot:jgi/Picre1/29734/NNA_005117.t1